MAGNSSRAGHSRKASRSKPKHSVWKHTSGYWCRKHRQKPYYFGRVENDPDGVKAQAWMDRDWPFIVEGRPRPSGPPDEAGSADYLTLKALCNAFIGSKRAAVEAGELSPRTLENYYRTCSLLMSHFGGELRVDAMRPEDFERFRAVLAEDRSPVGLLHEVNHVRVVFKYAADNRLIDRPVHYGQGFNRPSTKALRKVRNERGPRMFDAVELRTILAALDGKPVPVEGEDEPVSLSRDPALKAAVLLGVNGGLGNSDIGNLPQRAFDLENGWLEYPRVKTEIQRRIPLWPETVQAIRDALVVRPKPRKATDAGLVFLTSTGRRLVRVQDRRKEKDGAPASVPIDGLAPMFSKVLNRIGINGRRGFYTLRHVTQTIGGEARDPDAVAAIMGHVDSSMGAVYRERISDDRLRAVVETVRSWLWPECDRTGGNDHSAGIGESGGDDVPAGK
ncbi:MAG: hypothetical protein WD066_16660 [Planctomycetaceae bacterium]